MITRKTRVGVLISGRGSNMMALVEAARDPAYPAEIACVVSNQPDAPGLAWADEQGLNTLVVNHTAFDDRQAFDEKLDEALTAANVEVLALAGFMRLLTPWFVDCWRGRMLNIHPSLLPAFKGLNTHARALAAGVKIAGCTVHVVKPDTDDGPILAQAAVPVLPNDTEDTLAARVLAAEHRIYPVALARFLNPEYPQIVDDARYSDEPGRTLFQPELPAVSPRG